MINIYQLYQKKTLPKENITKKRDVILDDIPISKSYSFQKPSYIKERQAAR